MRRKGGQTTARLFLDEQDVGEIEVKGWDDAWGFGEFSAGDGFRRYAPHFREWSRLLHGTRPDGALTDADKAALRCVEYQIDRLDARLFLAESGQWRRISELNIDGSLVEWREKFEDKDVSSAA